MDTSFLLTNGLGLAAFLTCLAAYTCKSDRHLKIAVLVGLLLWAAYYAVLGAMTAVGMALLLAARQGVSLARHRLPASTLRGLFATFLLAFTANALLTWQGWLSLLPWVASTLSTFAYLYLTGATLRKYIMAGDLAWAVYAVSADAWFHLVFLVCSTLLNVRAVQKLAPKAAAT